MIKQAGILKIAVVGPESTGKSTLARQLAKHFNTVWVPEFARSYCEKLTEPCTWQDEINIFNGQLALEQTYLPNANKLLICDTMFLTVKIWTEHVFNKVPLQVIDALETQHYDFYLLTDIDLPWEDDPLRDFPGEQEYFMQVWVRELNVINAHYKRISGEGEHRLTNAINAVTEFLKLS